MTYMQCENFPGRFVLTTLIVLTGALLGAKWETNSPGVRIETVAESTCWVSPCWGYNAPKIVRNSKGEEWAINFFGDYPVSKSQIMKRMPDGKWKAGRIFEGVYQPGMIFLDEEGRLNVIYNSQTDPEVQYRSTDEENLDNFELIAKGNGQPDGRGWYTGVGVHGTTVYLSYVTLNYNFYLTWKNVTDSIWHQPILLDKGNVDTVRGNHAWLYPRFYFHGKTGYISVSSSEDGSVHNTYNKVYVITFPLTDPSKYKVQLVYDGPLGYYTYCTDTIVLPDGTIICAFTAGRHSYGPVVNLGLPEGLYVSVKKAGSRDWRAHMVDSHSGAISINYSRKGELYALMTLGNWQDTNTTLLKKSSNLGESWKTVNSNVFQSLTNINHPYFLQTAHSQSGSSVDDLILAILTNAHTANLPDKKITFDLLSLELPITE